jgi:hypothetical protein
MSISTSTNPTTSIAPTIQTGTFNITPNAVAAFHTKTSAQRSSTTVASHPARARVMNIADATVSQIGPVIALAIVQEIAPVIALATARAIGREIAPQESATAVQGRVMSEVRVQALVMLVAVAEIRTSAVT